MKSFLRKIIPKSLLRFYHLFLVELAALWYGYPSRQMVVIGITGTKGKSSTSYLITKILESAGYKVGLSSTVLFKIGEREWLNPHKMTMLGRFALQKMLREMVASGCGYAVVEVSSEGILQNRHRAIDFNVAVFTNLSPEHIESHGSFANYRAAKAELFKSLKNIKIDGKNIPRTIIVNADDKEAEYFAGWPADKKIGFSLENKSIKGAEPVFVEDVALGEAGADFKISGQNFNLKLIGRFNIYNAAAAAAATSALGIPLQKIAAALGSVSGIPGRLELIDGGRFKVVVDYAHEPASMEELFSALNLIPHGRIIHVFGGTGGGRDKEKRAVLGAIAAKNADYIIITNDDPYGDDPDTIAGQIIEGIGGAGSGAKYEKILDRRTAISKAIRLAKENDLVLITGKGAEQAMMMGDKKIPWDDRKIVRECLKQS